MNVPNKVDELDLKIRHLERVIYRMQEYVDKLETDKTVLINRIKSGVGNLEMSTIDKIRQEIEAQIALSADTVEFRGISERVADYNRGSLKAYRSMLEFVEGLEKC